MKTSITIDLVKKIATLANLSLTEAQVKTLVIELQASFAFIDKIQSLDTSGIEETSQVTGLENVLREDVIDHDRILIQEAALSNAPSPYNGYFKVKAIFDEE